MKFMAELTPWQAMGMLLTLAGWTMLSAWAVYRVLKMVEHAARAIRYEHQVQRVADYLERRAVLADRRVLAPVPACAFCLTPFKSAVRVSVMVATRHTPHGEVLELEHQEWCGGCATVTPYHVDRYAGTPEPGGH